MIEKVTVYGKDIKDKNTHYAFYCPLGPVGADLIIRSDIAIGFRKKYRVNITDCKSFDVEAYFGRNGDRVVECRDVYKPLDYLFGNIDYLEDITNVSRES